jgi:hypothetical protein
LFSIALADGCSRFGTYVGTGLCVAEVTVSTSSREPEHRLNGAPEQNLSA